MEWFDSIEVAGSYRRRLHLQGSCWPNEVVERIGSLTGPLEWAYSMVDAGGSLACLEEDGEQVYAPYPRQCDLNVSVPSIVMIHHREPVVRPNGTGKWMLGFNDGTPLFGAVQILDPLGHTMAR